MFKFCVFNVWGFLTCFVSLFVTKSTPVDIDLFKFVFLLFLAQLGAWIAYGCLIVILVLKFCGLTREIMIKWSPWMAVIAWPGFVMEVLS